MFESALGKASHVYHGCKVIVTKKLDELLFGASTRPHGIDGRFSQPRDTPSNPQLPRAPYHKLTHQGKSKAFKDQWTGIWIHRHGLFPQGDTIPIMKKRTKISKFMSYILRHNPTGLDACPDGIALVDDRVNRLQERNERLNRKVIEDIVNKNGKGRFESKADRLRARYGQSIHVSAVFPLVDMEALCHGASRPIAERILRDGLRPMKRNKVHLTRSIVDALPLCFVIDPKIWRTSRHTDHRTISRDRANDH